MNPYRQIVLFAGCAAIRLVGVMRSRTGPHLVQAAVSCAANVMQNSKHSKSTQFTTAKTPLIYSRFHS
jgi:hypothetical protein